LRHLSDFLRPHILTQIPLTSGEWSVIDKPLKVDWSSGFVYFHGLKDSPLEKHLYVVSIQQPGVGIIKRFFFLRSRREAIDKRTTEMTSRNRHASLLAFSFLGERCANDAPRSIIVCYKKNQR
jgi:hypothetical protein